MNRCKELGYNFLFIIDKDYSKFDLLIKEYLIENYKD